MPHFRGMEYMQEAISLDEIPDRLAELSLDNWELVSVVSGHANPYELGELAQMMIFLKRPRRRNL